MERRTDDREDKDNLLDSLHHHLSCKRMVRTAQTMISKFERYHQLGYRQDGQLFYKRFHRNGENGRTRYLNRYLCTCELSQARNGF